MSDWRADRESYRVLYEDNPSMYFAVRSDGRVLSVNRFGAEQLGYSRGELIGQPVTAVFHEEDRDAVMRQLAACCADPGTTFDWELRKVRRDGEVMWVHERARAVPFGDDEWMILIVCEDISDRRRSQEALRRAHDEMERRVVERTAELEKQRAFLRQVIDIDPNFIFAKDREGRFTLVNQATAEAYGTTVEGLTGRTDAEFNPNAEEVAYFRQKDLEVMDKLQELFIPEEVVTDAEGRQRWLQTVKRPIVGKDGLANQVLGSATDITARREAEIQLHRSQKALLASQRELRALTGQLLTAQEEERRRLAREIHDDFAQRLAGLAILAEGIPSLHHGSFDNAVRAKIERLGAELERLATDVRTLSHELHPSTLEDLGLVEALRAECKGFSEHSAIEIDFVSQELPQDLSRELGIVFYRITQAALSNVLRHANTCRASVSICREGDWVRLEIEDFGRGFDLDAPGRKRGIGLAGMQERARLVGAEFAVDAAPGRGVRITVRARLEKLPA